MGKADVARQSDLEKLRSEILAEVANHFDATLGEAIVGRIAGRLSDRASHIQQAEAAAIAARDQAQRETGLFEDRLVRVKTEIGELSRERNDLQTTLDGLRAEYDGLLPKVQELRAEEESYRVRVAAKFTA